MKRYVITLCMAFLYLLIHAQEVNSLVIYASTGSDDKTPFAMTDLKNLSFDPATGGITLTLLNGETKSFNNQDWKASFEYIELGAITDLDFSDQATIEIWSIDGVFVGKADNISKLKLNSLPKGVYIVRQGNKTIKITL